MEKGRYQYLWQWLKGYKRVLFTVLFSSILVTLLGMNWPLMYRYIINHVFYSRSYEEWRFILTVYAVMFVAEKLLQLVWRLADAVMASDFLYHIKEELYRKIFSMKMKSIENYSTGELLDIVNQDVNQLYTFLVDEGVFAITCFVRLVMAMIYIYLINKMTAVFIFVLVVLNFFLSRYLKEKFMTCFRKYKENLESYQGFLLDILAGLKEIKLFLAVGYVGQKMSVRLAELGYWKKKQFIEDAHRDICHDGWNVIAEMLLYGMAAYEVSKERMLLGDFVSLMIYYEWAKIFFRIFVQIFIGASKSFVCLDRINRLMWEESETDGELENQLEKLKDKDKWGEILFDHITFGYENGREVLKGIHFHIPSHSIIAIAGASGSGKSTIASLLLKLYEPCQGDIYIDGKRLSEMSARHVRARIGIVQQNARLIEGTIRKNLLMGKPEAQEWELWRALKVAQADRFVSQFPRQLDTEINGIENLSTGQNQRIAIARMFLKDPDILIMDEATSNIDLETECLILRDAARIFRKKTVILIAYREESLKIADQVLYLKDGTIKDFGTHLELWDRNPEYRKLISA